MPSDEAIKELTALRGVGRWTAEYVLMRGLGHPDVIPAADVGLQSAIGRAYGLGRKATEPEVRTLAEQWVPRRSHAAFAWWWSLSAERGHTAPPP
jgi:DNA-3-methyladenine glycosylase II